MSWLGHQTDASEATSEKHTLARSVSLMEAAPRGSALRLPSPAAAKPTTEDGAPFEQTNSHIRRGAPLEITRSVAPRWEIFEMMEMAVFTTTTSSIDSIDSSTTRSNSRVLSKLSAMIDAASLCTLPPFASMKSALATSPSALFLCETGAVLSPIFEASDGSESLRETMAPLSFAATSCTACWFAFKSVPIVTFDILANRQRGCFLRRED